MKTRIYAAPAIKGLICTGIQRINDESNISIKALYM